MRVVDRGACRFPHRPAPEHGPSEGLDRFRWSNSSIRPDRACSRCGVAISTRRRCRRQQGCGANGDGLVRLGSAILWMIPLRPRWHLGSGNFEVWRPVTRAFSGMATVPPGAFGHHRLSVRILHPLQGGQDILMPRRRPFLVAMLTCSVMVSQVADTHDLRSACTSSSNRWMRLKS